MIGIIRIAGQVNVDKDVENTLFRLRLRQKYACVVLEPSKELEGMIKKIRSFISYGEINKETFLKLVEARGELIDKKKKTDKKGAEQYFLGKGKLQDYNIKAFFRLHPPRGGIDSKKHFGVSKNAVLGDNKKNINALVRRML